MKVPNKGNRPLPILLADGGDYINDCHFNFSLDLLKAPKPNEIGDYTFKANVDMHCPPLESLIDLGDAKIYICIEQDTVREFVEYYDDLEIPLNPKRLRLSKPVELTPIIVATHKTLLKFDADYMDEFYGYFDDQEYAIESKQILGYGQTAEIKTYAIKGLSQIVSIQELTDKDAHHPFILSLDQDKIIIKVNKEITHGIKAIQENSSSLDGLVNSAIAYNAFYMVLERMIFAPSKYSGYRWFDAIKSKINKVRIARKEDLFDPETFINGSIDESFVDELWNLTSELLTDGNKQLMITGFYSATKFAEGMK